MLNKLDILSGVDPLRICVAYEIDGRRVETWPSSGAALSRATPIYEEFDGWTEPIHAVRSLGDLPENARRYVIGHREPRRRADRARVGRAGADPDDRAGVPADAPAPGDPGMSGGRLVMPTRILIVGAGAREHALAWRLSVEPGVNTVFVAPGSDAMAAEPRVRRLADVDPLDGASVVAAARAVAAELVVIGPEAPLAAGVADALEAAGIAVFGPSAAAARIEASKAFCHEIAAAAGVPMARSGAFDHGRRRRRVRPRAGGGRARASSSRPTASRPARA